MKYSSIKVPGTTTQFDAVPSAFFVSDINETHILQRTVGTQVWAHVVFNAFSIFK